MLNLTSGFCYELTLANGGVIRFKFLDDQGGSPRIMLLPGGQITNLTGPYDADSLRRVSCGDHTDNE